MMPYRADRAMEAALLPLRERAGVSGPKSRTPSTRASGCSSRACCRRSTSGTACCPSQSTVIIPAQPSGVWAR